MPTRNFECLIYGGLCANRDCRERDFCAREKDEMQKGHSRTSVQKIFRHSPEAQQRIRESIAKAPRIAGKYTE